MRFRTIHRIAVVAASAVAAAGTLLIGDRRQVGAMVLVGAAGVAVYYGIVFAAHRLRHRAYFRATTGHDVPALRAAFERYSELFCDDARPGVRAHLSLHEASVLAQEHRWREAASCLERLDVHAAHPIEAVGVASLRAYVLAHLGDDAGALAVIDDVLAKGTAEERAQMTHVRGIVLQRLGRNEEALDLLSIPRDRPQRAGSLFYLGEARRGLGRFDEAVETYENVLGLPGDSEWHRRAREALASLQRSAPFR